MATTLVLKSSKRTKFEQISRSFFDLPLEAKNRVRRELSKNVFRGYYGYGFLENSQQMSIYQKWKTRFQVKYIKKYIN